ncbi:hypothetical protein PMAC_001663 [Pneumocystis sp. 'macacae']|nr:hypothetical protein PMAC_001663 [Pneumocystis sp. 'macacae']
MHTVDKQAQAVEGVYDDQEILLALILKEEIDNRSKKCKTSLKKYCKILKEIDENINVYPKLKKTCKEDTTAQKCRGLKTNIQAKSTKFKAEFDKVPGKAISALTYEDCKKTNEQSLFLEEASPNELKNKYIELKIKDTFLRALTGNFENDNACRNTLKRVFSLAEQENICVNLRALCHTVGTKRSNLNSFWKKLKEESPSLDLDVFNFENESTSWSSVNKPIENACAKFGATNEILFRCDLFTRLLYDFSWRHKDLVWSFNYTDGNRTLTECAYYFSECNSLSTIFRDLTHNCTTLRKTCLNGYKPKKPMLMKSI